jgi:hypothetical protein
MPETHNFTTDQSAPNDLISFFKAIPDGRPAPVVMGCAQASS